MNPTRCVTLAALASALLYACASTSDAPDPTLTAAPAPIADSFQPKGQAGLDRLEQNPMQAICSEYEGKALPDDKAKLIIDAATANVRFPEDGRYFGDWHYGEAIAKSGTGLQSSDDPAKPNGANCYACHQLAPAEIAYGTLGPSLAEYGKLRGSTEPVVKYAWTRLWNSHAYNACSHMPRFGEARILTEAQLKDVMAYLFDPASPVNVAGESGGEMTGLPVLRRSRCARNSHRVATQGIGRYVTGCADLSRSARIRIAPAPTIRGRNVTYDKLTH
jgi:sulfur-oxidizing protein SoxX